MGEAFFGYLLPGADVFWGAQVIVVNLFSAIPDHRPRPVIPDHPWRFRRRRCNAEPLLSFHVIAFPLVLIGLVAATSWRCTKRVPNNPDGIEIKANKDENGIPRDGIPFHPYYTVKDIVGVVVFP